MSANADYQRINAQLNSLQLQVRKLEGRIVATANVVPSQTPTTPESAPENFIRNGDASHSWDTHQRAITVADDARFECWEIFTHTAPTPGQQLLENTVYGGSLVGVSTALPDPGRSDTPTTDPNWKRSAGYIRLGSNHSLDFPLPRNQIAYPGRLLAIRMIAARASETVDLSGSRLCVAIWDNTAGQRKIIEAADFEIDARTIGSPVGTVSRDYFAIANLDSGLTLASNTFTVADAPDDSSFLSPSIYVEISWRSFPGLRYVDIYRDTGGTIVWLRRVTGSQYFDYGAIRQSVGAFPDAIGTKEQAFARTKVGALNNLAIDGVAAAWDEIEFTIHVPDTYNMGNTTDKLWLRVYFDVAPSGTGATHGVYLDLIRMGYKPGAFANNVEDKGEREPNTAPDGSSQGGSGTGGGDPDPGDGGTRCVAEDSQVYFVDTHLNKGKITARDIRERETCVIAPEGDQMFVEQVQAVNVTWAERTLTITTESGHRLRCSPSEPFRRNFADQVGQRADKLKVGEYTLVFDEEMFFCSKIKSIEETPGCDVVMLTLAAKTRKHFIACAPDSAKGGFVLHNAKPIGEFGP